jgi:hypothetical protein
MLGTLAQLLMQLYISFGLALLYFDLKLRREGDDLEAQIQQLAQPGTFAPPPEGGTTP